MPNSAVAANSMPEKVCSVHTNRLKVLISIFPDLYIIVKERCVSPGYSLRRETN
jgi:hypothetical protein